jgi:hypothetical protein
MSNAIAVLFNALISNPKTRLFNGIPHISSRRLPPVTLLLIPLWLFRGTGDVCGENLPGPAAVSCFPPARNGIAIRACFGKPAFVSMQHGRRQAGPFLEANNGNSDDLRPFQEEKPKPRDC